MPIDSEVSWGVSSAVALNELYSLLGPEKCAEFANTMFTAGDRAFEEYVGDRQTKGKIRKGYYDWARKMRQAMRDVGDKLAYDARDPNDADVKMDAPLGDPELKDFSPQLAPEPVDPMTQLLDEAVLAFAPAPSPTKALDLSQADKDELVAALDQEQAVVAARKGTDAFLEAEAQRRLKVISEITNPGDFLRVCLPEIVTYQGRDFIFLSSATFLHKGSTFVRNCVVDEQSVKVGHDDVYRLEDNTRSHLIRSAVVGEGGQKNRYVKVLHSREGMLIRYFTQVEKSNRDPLAWYGVIRKGQVSQLTYGEYKTLEAALKKQS